MSFQETPSPPVKVQQPLAEKSKGGVSLLFSCLGCLGILIAVPIVLSVIAYYVLFHTSLPLKTMFGEPIVINGKPVDFEGISGSISNGYEIEKITLQDEEDSVIEGLKFRYSGIWQLIGNQQFIIEEVSSKKSTLIVDNDFLDFLDDLFSEGPDLNPRIEDESEEVDVDFRFELKELNFANTNFHSLDRSVDINIPLVRLAGLKISGEEFDLGEFEIRSDFLDVVLDESKSVQMDGLTLPFKKKIVGKVMPEIHQTVRKEIDFVGEFGALESRVVLRWRLFNDSVELTSIPKRGTVGKIENLTLGDYFKIGSSMTPEKLTLTFETDEDKKTQVQPGEFFLGKTRFEISEQEFDGREDPAGIKAVANLSGQTIEATLRSAKNKLWSRVELKLNEDVDVGEIISRIYYQTKYEDLDETQTSHIDGLLESLKPTTDSQDPENEDSNAGEDADAGSGKKSGENADKKSSENAEA